MKCADCDNEAISSMLMICEDCAKKAMGGNLIYDFDKHGIVLKKEGKT